PAAGGPRHPDLRRDRVWAWLGQQRRGLLPIPAAECLECRRRRMDDLRRRDRTGVAGGLWVAARGVGFEAELGDRAGSDRRPDHATADLVPAAVRARRDRRLDRRRRARHLLVWPG